MFSHTKDFNKGSKFLLILISIILHNRLINIKQMHPLAELSSCRHSLLVYHACTVPFSHIYSLPSQSSSSKETILQLSFFTWLVFVHLLNFGSFLSIFITYVCIPLTNIYWVNSMCQYTEIKHTHPDPYIHEFTHRLVERQTSSQWCVLALTHVCVSAVVGEQRGNPNLTLTSFQEM